MMDMLQELFSQQRKNINHFFDHLDINAAEAVLEIFASCPGVIFFSGVGKSGFIAEKIAVTLVSTGTKAMFVPPTNALHGDLGIVSHRDVFVLISKSGESDELVTLVPYLRNRGVTLIAITSNPTSRLAKASDLAVHLPLLRELCPFDLSPTTSPEIQLIFGDVLATALMRRKNFSIDDYAQNHPAGRIGKRISTRVKDLMLSGESMPLCKENDRLIDVLVELSNKRCGCLLIVDDQQILKGIFTDGDLRRSLQTEGAHILHDPIHKVMTQHPRSTHPETLAWEAMKMMEADQKEVTVLPVLEDNRKIVGLIKLHDIIQSGV